MIVTEDILSQGQSVNGAWSREQLLTLLPWTERDGSCFGIKAGWRKRIVGKQVPKERIEKFLALTNAHIKKELTGSLF